MRYAIISDIHANRQAWQAVSTDIRCLGVDAVICLGDIVGYGPAPQEVLSRVYERADYFVLGNHDAVVARRLDPECFNDEAREVIEWTCGQLGRDAIRFFNEVPFLLDAEGFSCAHADYAEPDVFDYIMTPADAVPSLEACPEPILFVGHTHEPCVMQWTPDGRVQHRTPELLRLEKDWKYVINVGSVGDPRDGDLRASYTVLDLERGELQFRKVPFDLDAYRREHAAANLANHPAVFRIMDDLPDTETSAIAYLGNFSPIAEGIGGVVPSSERMRVKFDPEILRHMREQRSGGLSAQIEQQRELREREDAPRKRIAAWLILGCALLFLLSSIFWVVFRSDKQPTTAGGLELLDLNEANMAPLPQQVDTIRVLNPGADKRGEEVATAPLLPSETSIAATATAAAAPTGPTDGTKNISVVTIADAAPQVRPLPTAVPDTVSPTPPLPPPPPPPPPTRVVVRGGKTKVVPAAQKRRPKELYAAVATSLGDGDMTAALAHLGDDAPPGVRQVRKHLEAARDMDQRVLETFVDREGQQVAFVTRRGPITVRIVEVLPGKVRAERTVRKGAQTAAVPWEFTGAHLAEQEFLKRATAAGKEPFYLYRGLVSLKADELEQAAEHFKKLESGLGPALLAELDARVPERAEAAAAAALARLEEMRDAANTKADATRLLQALQVFQSRFGTTVAGKAAFGALREMDAEARERVLENLVSNGDFEAKNFTGWQLRFPEGKAASAAIGVRMPGRASVAAVALVPKPTAVPVDDTAPRLTQKVKLERGRLYELSFRAVPQHPKAFLSAGAGELRSRTEYGPARPAQNRWLKQNLLFRAESAEVEVSMGGGKKTDDTPMMIAIDDVRLTTFHPPLARQDLSFAGHRYRLLTLPANPAAAQAACEQMGGHLVTLQNEEEWRAIAEHWKEEVKDQRLLLGLSHQGRGKYGWVTGEQPRYNKLHPGFMRDPSRHGECVTFGLNDGDTWDFGGRDRAYWFVCEWGAPPGRSSQ